MIGGGKMLKAYRYRLYPNKEQKIYFSKCFGSVRFIYNKMLNDKIEYYKENNKMLNKKLIIFLIPPTQLKPLTFKCKKQLPKTNRKWKILYQQLR